MKSVRTVPAFIGAVVVILALCACSAPAPSVPSPVPTNLPTVTGTTYLVPPPQKGELGRIVLTPGTNTSETVTVPANHSAYDVEFGCTGTSKSAKFGFRITHGSEQIVGAMASCDGSNYRDTAIGPAHPKESVNLSMVGDMTSVSGAYLVLLPASGR
jgi:hypothetical protein